MTVLEETFTLNNGVTIPKIGFGTWLIPDETVAEHVEAALKAGYRHIDTAQGYRNERGVGQGFRTSGLSREEVFITTKIQASIKDYHQATASIDESLQKLDMDYIDLVLIHAPQPWDEENKNNHFFEGNLETWRAMEDAMKAGKICTIGVSNFEEEDLENILKNSQTVPAVNQLLVHIGQTPFELVDYCKDRDILVEAYSPVAHGDMLHNKALQEIADTYHVSIPQLAIRYCLQIGTLPLPKSENPQHITDNAAVDFEISAEDMTRLKKITQIKA